MIGRLIKMSIIIIIFLYVFVLIFFFLFINLKWCINTLRSIANYKNKGGYTKLIQMGLVFVLVSVFLIIIIHYIRNPEQVSRIDIILTVIVGWLGAIISSFFGEKSMENLDEARKNNTEEFKNRLESAYILIEKYEDILRKRKVINSKKK